jgi:two-component sensor histidine kinase
MSVADPAPRRAILIVEDDPGVAELVEERLEEIGCACSIAATGRAAIAILRQARFDLLVLDYSLPDMHADELIMTEGIPPFMITTGKGDETTAVRLMRAGARDYLIKDSSFLDELPLVAARVLRELDTERSLEEARASLEARLRENDAMLREIHHRVKNNLQIVSSLIRLQIPLDADDRILGIMSDIQGRISAMSLIHETLYESENLAQVDFLDYLDALIDGLRSALMPEDRDMSFLSGGDSFELPIDRAVPLGLIANELLTNSIKHAFPPSWRGIAEISILAGHSANGAVFLEVRDNGVGVPDLASADSMRGAAGESARLGFKLVDLLAQQLGASLSLGSSSGGAGTLWRIELRAWESGNLPKS